MVESSIFQPGGTWTMTVERRDGGSHIEIVNDRKPKGFQGFMGAAMMSVAGKSFLTKSLQKTIDIVKQERERQPAGSV